MTGSIKKRLIGAAGGVGALRVVSLGIGLLTSVILARNLGAESYGTYVYVTSILSLLAMPLHAGLPALLVRETARYQVDQNWAKLKGLCQRVRQWVLLAGAALCGLVFLFWALNGWPRQGVAFYLVVGCLLMPLMALNSTRGAILRGLKFIVSSRFPEALIQPGCHLCLLLVAVSAAVINTEVALLSLMLSTGIACLAGQLLLGRRTRALFQQRVPEYDTKDWVRSWLPFTFLAFITTTHSQLSVLLLGLFSAPEEVAHMRIAIRLGGLVTFAMMITNMVIGPYIAEAHKNGDLLRLRKLAQTSIRAAFVISLPVAAALIMWGKPVLDLLYGPEFREPVWLPMVIICAGQLATVFLGAVGVVLNMSGYERHTTIGVGCGLVANLVLAVMLIPLWGAVGAAIAAAAGTLIWNLYMSFQVVRKLSIRVSVL